MLCDDLEESGVGGWRETKEVSAIWILIDDSQCCAAETITTL